MAKIIRLAPEENLTSENLREIAAAVRNCKILVFPTDTVYGIGSTGLIKAAARRIYEIKKRDSMKPLPILVHSTEEAKRWVQWTPAADSLARNFWPGPLTLVLRPTKEGRLLTMAEFPTLAIRVPAHPVALSLLQASGIPWATSSANISGSPSLKEDSKVVAVFCDLVDYIIEAGPTQGQESSLVDATESAIRVLREGRLSREQLLSAVNEVRLLG
jgi:L-threonylcarbamoyladenylate synthase